MPLTSIEMPDFMERQAPIPRRVAELLEVADSRIDRFVNREGRRIHGFVASDYVAAFSALEWVQQNNLLSGQTFCEWGCGFGVVTMLAALAGMDACGIEVESELVECAEKLAADLEIACQFSGGSLIPDGADRLVEFVEDIAHIDTDSPGAYEDLGLDVDDFDLIYVYPWPGEERYLEDVFEHYAAKGALLLTYHGIEDLRLQRKI